MGRRGSATMNGSSARATSTGARRGEGSSRRHCMIASPIPCGTLLTRLPATRLAAVAGSRPRPHAETVVSMSRLVVRWVPRLNWEMLPGSPKPANPSQVRVAQTLLDTHQLPDVVQLLRDLGVMRLNEAYGDASPPEDFAYGPEDLASAVEDFVQAVRHLIESDA